MEVGAFIMVVTVIGILGWMTTARMVRGSVLTIKQTEFVEAAVNIGARSNSIMARHILPNVLGIIVVAATLEMAAAILTESTISFLGMGFPPDVPTWGSLLYYGRDYMTQSYWMVLFPGLMISLTILAINVIGDGLRDALDPRAKEILRGEYVMTETDFNATLSAGSPPAGISPALQALWYAAKGDWNKAHDITQPGGPELDLGARLSSPRRGGSRQRRLLVSACWQAGRQRTTHRRVGSARAHVLGRRLNDTPVFERYHLIDPR